MEVHSEVNKRWEGRRGRGEAGAGAPAAARAAAGADPRGGDEAFARSGFAATGLDDIAAEAGITRVILYRHFDSKTDLYQAVLDRFCAVMSACGRAGGRVHRRQHRRATQGRDRRTGRVPAAVSRTPAASRSSRQRIERFRADITAAATCRSRRSSPTRPWARWAAQLAPTVAIEAIIAWLDAGQPDPDLAADRVRQGHRESSARPPPRRDCSLP